MVLTAIVDQTQLIREIWGHCIQVSFETMVHFLPKAAARMDTVNTATGGKATANHWRQLNIARDLYVTRKITAQDIEWEQNYEA